MERALIQLNVDKLIERPRHGARLIVARQSEFQKREGNIDPGDIGPIAWRQSLWCANRTRHYSAEGLILTPPPQPSDELPALLNLEVSGGAHWGRSLTVELFYFCQKRDIIDTFEEHWSSGGDFWFGSFVVVLSDLALLERIRPSSN